MNLQAAVHVEYEFIALSSCMHNYAYAGGRVGSLDTLQHQVSGTLYFIDTRTIFIDDFNYDGQGPGV